MGLQRSNSSVRLLLALCGLVGYLSPASAQQLGRIVNNPYGNPYEASVVQVRSPYWGYSYSYSFFSWGDYLHGAADVIRSQGQFMINKEEANYLHEKYLQEKVYTRRKEVEHWVWERELKNEVYERERERILQAEIKRDLTDPPQTQIFAGASLNLLLNQLEQETRLSPSGSVSVKKEWLPHINVTFVRTGTGGNVGLLKGDHIAWPFLLRMKEFTPQRESIDQLIAQAKQEALAGRARAETLLDARRQVAELEKRIAEESRANRNDLYSPSDYYNAKRSLREVSAALQMLDQEDAAFYLTPLQGETVAELVDYMKTKGLNFAPATTGGHRSYIALHRALASEVTRVRGR
jgi:hypothetical protein